MVPVPVKDRKQRLYVDYRTLNAMAARDTYPLPRIDECIDSLGNAAICFTNDCDSGFRQTGILEADRAKSTLSSRHGLFQFIRMPIGLKCAPALLRRAADIILSVIEWQFVLTYSDDIIVHPETITGHLVRVRTVLTLLQIAGVALELSKCFFSDYTTS